MFLLFSAERLFNHTEWHLNASGDCRTVSKYKLLWHKVGVFKLLT